MYHQSQMETPLLNMFVPTHKKRTLNTQLGSKVSQQKHKTLL